MTIKRIQYFVENEKKSIIEEQLALGEPLYGEANITEGNFLLFGKEEPALQPPTEIELLKQENATIQLALAETIEKQETDQVHNQVALAEVIETLYTKGVL